MGQESAADDLALRVHDPPGHQRVPVQVQGGAVQTRRTPGRHRPGGELALAAVGTYGVLSCAAGERKREIAIRMALGAMPGSVKNDLLGRGLFLAATGIAIGAAAAWILGSYLESFLFGISARDPLSFGVSALVLVVTALAASYVPAHRASRADPWSTLRSE